MPTGHYLLADSTTVGHVARIRTPPYIFPGDFCLEFFYHMRGHNMGTLNVYTLAPGETTDQVSPIWTMSGHQGSEWQKASLDVSSASHFEVCVYLKAIPPPPPPPPHTHQCD